MSDILVLGAGLNGLATAMLLARDGHQRHGPRTRPGRAAAATTESVWESWERRASTSSASSHFMLPRWRDPMRPSSRRCWTS